MGFSKKEIETNGNYGRYLKEANDAEVERTNFLKLYSPAILKELSGINLLRTMFYNDSTKDSMCVALQSKETNLWVNVGGSPQNKFRLYFGNSKKLNLKDGHDKKRWTTGTPHNPKELTEIAAINLGTQIRNELMTICDYIEETSVDARRK